MINLIISSIYWFLNAIIGISTITFLIIITSQFIHDEDKENIHFVVFSWFAFIGGLCFLNAINILLK